MFPLMLSNIASKSMCLCCLISVWWKISLSINGANKKVQRTMKKDGHNGEFIGMCSAAAVEL